MKGGAPLAIVDAHHHLWQLDRGHYPWLQDAYQPAAFFLGDYRALRHDYLPAQYRRDTQADGAGRVAVLATVHVEAERDRAEAVAETAWLHGPGWPQGIAAAVVAYAPFGTPGCAALLARQAGFARVRGIRCKPLCAVGPGGSVAGQAGSMQDQAWLDDLARLPRHGLSWDLRVPFWHLREAAQVAAALPDLRIALNHTGLPLDRSDTGLAQWRHGMEALAACPNVMVKLSEFGLPGGRWDAPGNRRIVREALAIFGPERAMFGSNLPVASLSASFGTVLGLVCEALPDPAARARVLAGNAARFYRIADADMAPQPVGRFRFC
ncbi:amidohydrolase family protein [Cupriavidus taiwanensis]|uniref:Amidohydrolase 2 n=1 Tax=Cupriavidus taiwanensis TaxID=164546 RepID=A0A375C0R6_9BURK|nr:putative amidohydrolase 2 [Cupriavidus taiwanensis]